MKRKAFTLVEMLMVITIMMLMSLWTASFTRNSLVNSEFQTTINEIKNSLVYTQNLSRQSFLDMSSGVAFAEDSFTEFTADTYSPADANNFTFDLPTVISIGNIDFGGATEVYFQKYLGDPIATGSIDVVHEDGRSATISVDAEGNILVTTN